MAHRKEPRTKRKQNHGAYIYAMYALLAVFVVAYIATGSILAGAAAFVTLAATLVLEVKSSISEEGAMRTVLEIGGAILIVVAVFVVLSLVLQAPFPPVSAVASCSMLPTLHRGDLVVLHGIPNMTEFLESHNVPIVNVSPQRMNSTLASMNSEFLAYFAYDPSNTSRISDTAVPGAPIALYNTRCLDTYSELGEYWRYGSCFAGSDQGNNLVQYSYSLGNVSYGSTVQSIVLTQSITINGTRIAENYSNPIIVYRTTPNDSFSGDIVHRLVAAIRAGNSYYLLTKGDNNQGLDMQFSNYPATQSQVLGYVMADVPVIGYLKLIVSGQLATPSGCNSTILR